MIGNSQYFGSYTTGGLTATAGTVITALLPPSNGNGNSPPTIFVMQGASGPGSSTVGTFGVKYQPSWMKGTGSSISHLASLNYTVSTTAHHITILRPLNFTYLTAAAAAGATSLSVAGDPGVYSTNYQYAFPGGTGLASGPTGPSQVADRAVVSGDYIVYQLFDGTWYLDTVAAGVYSAGTLAVTNGPPSPTVTTNGGCYALSPVFLMGPAGSSSVLDPATGQQQPQFTTGTSTTTQMVGNLYAGGVATLHRGDPLVIVSNNVTAAGTIEEASVMYARY